MPENTNTFVMVTYANGKFILSGINGGSFEYSADGQTWTSVNIIHLFDNGANAGSNTIKRIACGADRMVAVGYYGVYASDIRAVIAYCNYEQN
jgi:hypothetical protein